MRRSRRLERANVESNDAEGPVRCAGSAGVATPDILVGVDEALEAVLGHEGEEGVEVFDVVEVVDAAAR